MMPEKNRKFDTVRQLPELHPFAEILNFHRKIYLDKFRGKKKESGGFKDESREYGYYIETEFFHLYSVKESEGSATITRLASPEKIRANPQDLLKNGWTNLARNMFFGLYGERTHDGEKPFIGNGKILFKEGKFQTKIPIDTDETFWMFKQRLDGDGRFEFADPNAFYYLVSRYYVNCADSTEILEKLDKDNFLNKEHLSNVIPLLSFIAEHVLLHRQNEFDDFIYRLAEKIGNDSGFEAYYYICNDLLSIVPEKPVNDWKQENTAILESTIAKTNERYNLYRYKYRTQIVSNNELELSIASGSFWEELFRRSGVETIMQTNFNGAEIYPVLEIARRERKIIPGLVLMFAHLLGHDPESAKKLAALSQFAWGVIVSYDNLVDSHLMRKNYPTELAKSGMPIALDRTMLALNEVLKSALSENDTKLVHRFLNMLGKSCEGDLESRILKWDTDYFWFTTNMQKLVSAFTWFPDFMGEVTGNSISGYAFSEFLINMHIIGQMNNDFEDFEPDLNKHDRGNDIGKRISLFLATLVGLPDEIIPREEKDKIKSLWNSPLDSSKEEILRIGFQYRSEVAKKLHPVFETFYREAITSLEKGIDSLPVKDENNQKFEIILLMGLENEWQKFKNYTHGLVI